MSWFFASIRALYGAAKFASQWPTEDDERAAKNMWAPSIVKRQRWELENCLHFAKANMHTKQYRFPDIALILQADSQPGASGQAAASFRDWRDNLSAGHPVAALEQAEHSAPMQSAGLAGLRALIDEL